MSQQSEDDPSTSPLLFSTPPNEIYFGEEKTIEEGGEEIEKFVSTKEKTISETTDDKINFVGEPIMGEKPGEGSHKEECGLESQSDAFGTSLNQQNSLEDKFKSFSIEDNEEENIGELNEDMDFKEEKRENHKISQEKDDSSAAKINNNNNEILVSSQMMDDKPCASSVIFFSPNNNTKMEEILMEQGEDSEKQGEDSEAKLDLPEGLLNKNNREEEHEDPEPLQTFSNKNNNLLGTTPTISNISCIKMSASIADLLPSRFPIEENEQNKNNKKESKLEGLAAKTVKMVYSATFNNTFPSCEGEGSIGKEDMKIKKLNQKPLEGDITNKNNSNIPTTKVNTTNRRTSLSKIFTNFRLQLEKTKTAFLTTSSSTDELKKPLNKRKNLNNIPITRSFTTSLASPSTSSSSLDNYLRRRRENKNKGGGGGSFLKKKCVEEKMDKQQQQQYYTTTEDFTASNSEQLTILSGQRVEILNNCDVGEDNNNNNEFVKVAVLDKSDQRENEGMVPKRILTPLDSPDQPTPSTSHAHDETASTPNSSNNKRTSIRRFFTSSSQKGESKCRSSPSTTVIVRPKSATSTNSDFTTTNCNNNKILSPSTKINKNQQQEGSSLNNDLLDLPPPMDQIGGSGSGGGVENGGEHENELTENNITEATTEETTNTAPSPPQMTPEESSRLKRSYVLQELVETERAYVVDLASIVDGYIGTLKEMELSDEDREKVKIIFANIEQILDFHKSVFCKEIEKSLQDYEAAGNAFIKYERRLHTFYVKYCQNKPKSDFLVSQDNFEQLLFDVKDRLGHKVSINDLLIKPVQRITKYQLMLSDILKYTHRANDRAEVLERAHDVMRVVPKACDDMMQVGRLQGFQGNLTAQGRLIFQGTLIISDGNINQPFKGKERRVFLFEQSVIIAECIPPRKEYGNPLYNFKNQIMVNKMVLEENVVDEPLRFVLQSNDPNQPATFVAQSATSEDKEQWLIKLSTQLDQQKTFLAALVDPKRYLANSMGSMNISGKKDSSGSLGTPTSPGITPGNITIPTSGSGSTTSSGAISPTKPRATQQKSSGSKLFGFGKQKT